MSALFRRRQVFSFKIFYVKVFMYCLIPFFRIFLEVRQTLKSVCLDFCFYFNPNTLNNKKRTLVSTYQGDQIFQFFLQYFRNQLKEEKSQTDFFKPRWSLIVRQNSYLVDNVTQSRSSFSFKDFRVSFLSSKQLECRIIVHIQYC